ACPRLARHRLPTHLHRADDFLQNSIHRACPAGNCFLFDRKQGLEKPPRGHCARRHHRTPCRRIHFPWLSLPSPSKILRTHHRRPCLIPHFRHHPSPHPLHRRPFRLSSHSNPHLRTHQHPLGPGPHACIIQRHLRLFGAPVAKLKIMLLSQIS